MPDSRAARPNHVEGAGYFMLPVGPSIGAAVSSGGGDGTAGAYVALDAVVAADIYVYGVHCFNGDVSASVTYIEVDIAVGSATSEVIKSSVRPDIAQTGSGTAQTMGPTSLEVPLLVLAGGRLSVRTTDASGNAEPHRVSLKCVLRSDVKGG